MDLRSVAEVTIGNDLRASYESGFIKKYGIKPVLSEDDHVVFSWLASKFHEAQARSIVESYFRVQIRWVVENMHPAKGIRTNINACLATSQLSQPSNKGVGMRMSVPVDCDLCGLKVDLVVSKSGELDADRLCEECRKLPKTPSLADLESALSSGVPQELQRSLHHYAVAAMNGVPDSDGFKKFLSTVVSLKLSHELPPFDWNAYCRVVWLVIRFRAAAA